MDIVALLEELVNGLMAAEDSFFQHPDDFYSLETAVKSSTESFATGFLSIVLTSLNRQIRDNAWRKLRYDIQRTTSRTLISSVGDVTFECTCYKNRKDGNYTHLLEEFVRIGRNERFTEAAEAAILEEALKTSYSEAAKVIPSKQKITKTTVENKVHQIADELPAAVPQEKKKCRVLFIDADEDHVAEQHGRWSGDNKGFISRLAYVYEYKKDSASVSGRRELVNTFYFGGLYSGSKGVEKFWNNVQNYINSTYDMEELKRIYISGDGAEWIKSGAKILYRALYCADKFHLVKYINKAANQMLDEKDEARSELYRLLYKNDRTGFAEYTEQMARSASKSEPIEELRSYVLGNWAAVKRSLRNKLIQGCSAEGHVSHVLSARLSSRPMGWSRTGADRMTKLRCYERNYGRDKIIDLVRYSREKNKNLRTGTDGVPLEKISLREIRKDHYDQAKSYIERIQATIPGETARRTASIRMHILGLW